jgi:hypothetical protein
MQLLFPVRLDSTTTESICFTNIIFIFIRYNVSWKRIDKIFCDKTFLHAVLVNVYNANINNAIH